MGKEVVKWQKNGFPGMQSEDFIAAMIRRITSLGDAGTCGEQ